MKNGRPLGPPSAAFEEEQKTPEVSGEPLSSRLSTAAGIPKVGAEKEGEVDWNEAWKNARAQAVRRGGSEAWNRRAPSFARNAGKGEYVERMLELLDPQPTETVLDVGCGSGTLAVPLAGRVRSVTALDFSSRMLDLLRARLNEEQIKNVTPVLGSWEDDWKSLQIDCCDIALASRSLIVDDLRAALLKLDRAARLRVFITAPVGTGPIDPRVFAAMGRPHVPGPDYVFVYKMLNQLGIAATISFIPIVNGSLFTSLDEAVERMGWMVADPSPEEILRLRRWLERELVSTENGLKFPLPHLVKWAVLSWKKAKPA